MDSFRENQKEFRKTIKSQQKFRSDKHNLLTEEVNKITQCANDDKRIQSIESIETYVHGMSKDLVLYVKRRNEIYQCNKTILDFGVSRVILNITGVSRSWCKLNLGPLQRQLQSCYFPERIDVRRQYFYFLYKFLGIIGWE